MNRIRILFVDDHQEILNGLRRMCRGMRDHWQPSFALGGAEAISLIEREPFDVLVTDMRMPGVDGVQVLSRALNVQPLMVRIVLSGQYDIDHFIRSGWPAHRFLAKPCDSELLKQTIQQVLAMRSLLEDSELRELVTRANRLPSMPTVYAQIEEELRSENASMQRVGEIVARDVSLTAKILQLVNSPIFGGSRRVETPAQAVVMLGSDVIKSLALYIQTCASIPVPSGFSLERLSEHSMFVGRLARDIACAEGASQQVCSDAFLAGVLQNIGSLMIMAEFHDKYREILENAAREGRPVWQLEQECLGTDHARIGGYLLSLWGLSTNVVQAVAYHIHPLCCPDNSASFALTAVHVANALESEPGLNGSGIINLIDIEYLERKGLKEKVDKWQQLHQQIIHEREQ